MENKLLRQSGDLVETHDFASPPRGWFAFIGTKPGLLTIRAPPGWMEAIFNIKTKKGTDCYNDLIFSEHFDEEDGLWHVNDRSIRYNQGRSTTE